MNTVIAAPVKTGKATAHYIDNKEFYKKISEYKALVNEAKEKNSEKPKVTNYLGECFVKISNHLAYKSNFVNYTFRDEMILDGIENCLTYINNFDPTKSKNPFAYFTQITYFAFIRRIQKEKRHLDTKTRYIQSIDLQEILDEIEGDPHSDNEYLKWVKENLDSRAKDNDIIEKNNNPVINKRRPKYFDKKPENPSDHDLDNTPDPETEELDF